MLKPLKIFLIFASIALFYYSYAILQSGYMPTQLSPYLALFEIMLFALLGRGVTSAIAGVLGLVLLILALRPRKAKPPAV